MKCDKQCENTTNSIICIHIIKELIEDTNWKRRATINISPRHELWDDIKLSIQISGLETKIKEISEKYECEKLKNLINSSSTYNVAIPITFWKKPLMNDIDIKFNDHNCTIPSRVLSGNRIAELFLNEESFLNSIENEFIKHGLRRKDLVDIITSIIISTGKIRDYGSIENLETYDDICEHLVQERLINIFDEIEIGSINPKHLMKMEEYANDSVESFKCMKKRVSKYSHLFMDVNNGIEKISETAKTQMGKGISLEFNELCIYNVIIFESECKRLLETLFLENMLIFPYLALKDYLYINSDPKRKDDKVLHYFKICNIFTSFIYLTLDHILSNTISYEHIQNLKAFQSINTLANDSFLFLINIEASTDKISSLKIQYSSKNRNMNDKRITDLSAIDYINESDNSIDKMTYRINLSMANSKHLKVKISEAGYIIKEVDEASKSFFSRNEISDSLVHLHTNKESVLFPYSRIKREMFDKMLLHFDTATIEVKYSLRTFVKWVLFFFKSIILMSLVLPSSTNIPYFVAILPLLISLLTMFLLREWSIVHSLIRKHQRTIAFLTMMVIPKVLLEYVLDKSIDITLIPHYTSIIDAVSAFLGNCLPKWMS